MDFPRAWEITKASKNEDHHIDCSWRQAGLLCDCKVLTEHPEYLEDGWTPDIQEKHIHNWVFNNMSRAWAYCTGMHCDAEMGPLTIASRLNQVERLRSIDQTDWDNIFVNVWPDYTEWEAWNILTNVLREFVEE